MKRLTADQARVGLAMQELAEALESAADILQEPPMEDGSDGYAEGLRQAARSARDYMRWVSEGRSYDLSTTRKPGVPALL